MELVPKSLEVTQNDIDTFLAGHDEFTKNYYSALNEVHAREELNRIYASVKKQIQNLCYGSIDPTRSKEYREKCRIDGQNAILNLCFVSIYHKDKIERKTMEDISALVYHLYSVHPIFDADPVFKEKILSAIFTFGDYLKKK